MLIPPPEVEPHIVGGRHVWVVRDDLGSRFPGPNNGKVRSADALVSYAVDHGYDGVVTANPLISRVGWAVSYVCHDRGLPHYDIGYRGEGAAFYRKMSKAWGGVLIDVWPSRMGVARSLGQIEIKMRAPNKRLFWMPNGLSCPLSMSAFLAPVKAMRHLWGGALVLSCSSGTSMAAIINALEELKIEQLVVGVTPCIMPRRANTIVRLLKKKPTYARWKLRTSKMAYSEADITPSPFPCDMFLDRKAWHWLTDSVESLPEPIVFWNIGGEWSPSSGIEEFLRGDGMVGAEDISGWVKERAL